MYERFDGTPNNPIVEEVYLFTKMIDAFGHATCPRRLGMAQMTDTIEGLRAPLNVT